MHTDDFIVHQGTFLPLAINVVGGEAEISAYVLEAEIGPVQILFGDFCVQGIALKTGFNRPIIGQQGWNSQILPVLA